MNSKLARPYTNELSVGLAAVRKAARICQTVQESITPEVLDKKDHSPVTVADFASQAVVCRTIEEAFPADPVIAEEDSVALRQPENAEFLNQIHDLINRKFGRGTNEEICEWIDRGRATDSSSRFWTVDPIDGTKGFVRRDQYAIALALIVDGSIEMSVLGCPNLGTRWPSGYSLFYAIRGNGAFATTLEPSAEARAIRVTATADPALARFCESWESGHSSHSESAMIAERLGIQTEPVRMDSQAKYATVASGYADLYLRLPTKVGYYEKIWDHAAGTLIVQEAGGRVSDLTGAPLDFSLGQELRGNRGVVVTNGKIHDQVLQAVQLVMQQRS